VTQAAPQSDCVDRTSSGLAPFFARRPGAQPSRSMELARTVKLGFALVVSFVSVSLLSACGIEARLRQGREVMGAMQPGHHYRTFSSANSVMAPAIPKGAVVLVDESAYDRSSPKRGEIVVHIPPVETVNPFIKRVLAVPGDKLSIQGGRILVDGLRPKQPTGRPDYDFVVRDFGFFVDGQRLNSTEANIPPRSRWTSADRLPRDCYFLIGDAVNDSEDSHIWGCQSKDGENYRSLSKGKRSTFIGKVVKVL
jgi:signal peptidase I